MASEKVTKVVWILERTLDNLTQTEPKDFKTAVVYELLRCVVREEIVDDAARE